MQTSDFGRPVNMKISTGYVYSAYSPFITLLPDIYVNINHKSRSILSSSVVPKSAFSDCIGSGSQPDAQISVKHSLNVRLPFYNRYTA